MKDKTKPAAPKLEKDLTKEEWTEVEKVFSGFWGSVTLLIDGYEVNLSRSFYNKNRLCVMTYVNGVWKGEWFTKEHPEALKFAQPRVKSVYSKKTQERMKKIDRAFKRLGEDVRQIDWAKVVTTYSPCWFSFGSLKRHLRANNKSIELVKKT